MTINVALGANSVAPHARSSDRTARSATTEGARFDDALSDKQPKRKDEDTSAQDTAPHPRTRWSIDKLAARIDVDRAQLEDTLPESETEFEAVLDQLLGTTAEPMISDAKFPSTIQLSNIARDGNTSEAQAVQPDEPKTLPEQPGGSKTLPEQPDVGTPDLEQRQKFVKKAELEVAQSLTSAGGTDHKRQTANGPTAIPQDMQQSDTRRVTSRAARPASGPPPAPVATDKLTPQPDTRLSTDDAAPPRNHDLNRDDSGTQKAAASLRDGFPSTAKVNVLSFSASLPPITQTTLGITSAGLVSALESDTTWRSAAHESAQLAGNRPPNSTAGVNTLRIQLNPAELGMVTARLTTSGQQLSVEIQVESNEAHHKLTRDGDAILKTLRAVGYDVERVTITQSSQATSGNLQNGASSRDQFLQNQQSHSDSNAENRRNSDEKFGRESERATHVSGETATARVGSDIYI